MHMHKGHSISVGFLYLHQIWRFKCGESGWPVPLNINFGDGEELSSWCFARAAWLRTLQIVITCMPINQYCHVLFQLVMLNLDGGADKNNYYC